VVGVVAWWLIAVNAKQTNNFLLRLGDNNDNAKPAERQGRKATGPRFLREVTEDSPKDPKTAELPEYLIFTRGEKNEK
jgi:hypothetical protein